MQTDKRVTIKVICQGGDQTRVCLKFGFTGGTDFLKCEETSTYTATL